MLFKYIQQFLDDNDLTANEPFTIVSKDTGEDLYGKTFYINANATDTTNILMRSDNKGVYISALVALLNGICLPKKGSYRPQNGDIYYYVTAQRAVGKTTFFDIFTLDNLLRKTGKCYRTYEEAEKHLEQDYKYLVGENE